MRPITITLYLILFLTLSCVRAHFSTDDDDDAQCKAWLVQSIPTDMSQLSLVSGVLSTADVFGWLAANSSRSLNIMTQCWQLIAHPDDPRSGDYGYSKDDMIKFGAEKGLMVYEAIDNAADRNVDIRLLQHSGRYPDYTTEPSKLAFERLNVKSATLLLQEWWGSGLVHANIWISDHRDIYIGSAYNDWKSLKQMEEVGIYLVDCPSIAKKVEVYYNNLWKLANLNASAYTKEAFDQQWQINRKVPCWSHVLRENERCRSPLPPYVEVPHVEGYPPLSDPHMFQISIETPGVNNSTLQLKDSYLSFAPPELSFGKYQTDEQAWVDTIKSVGLGATVRICTFDWLGQSQYTSPIVYWSSISSAVSQVVFSKHAKVNILVASWAHPINNTDLYLKSLLYSNTLCYSSKNNECSGKVEIKFYNVPGYNMAGPAIVNGAITGNIYPDNTRVNQAKYAVSNVRAQIGTSNLIWDHLYTWAGISFGTYNPAIVSQLQEIFDADWNSPYAVPVEPLDGDHSYII